MIQNGRRIVSGDMRTDYDGIYDYVCTKLPEENDPDMFLKGMRTL